MVRLCCTGIQVRPNFDHLSHLITDTQTVSLGFIIGMTFIIAGLAFKISAAPFHMWVPDVYEGSMTEVTAFFGDRNQSSPYGSLF